jgi:hypothetical protein
VLLGLTDALHLCRHQGLGGRIIVRIIAYSLTAETCCHVIKNVRETTAVLVRVVDISEIPFTT